MGIKLRLLGGYYTFSSTAIRLRDLPEEIARRLPRYPLVPATLISRLAIDRRNQGQGWGSFLLLDALHRRTMSEIASFAVIVDDLDDEPTAFYRHESHHPGFHPSGERSTPDRANSMAP